MDKMRLFRIKTTGNSSDSKLVMITSFPKGMGTNMLNLYKGEKVGDAYPSSAEIHLDKKKKGIKISSLLGNIKNSLMVSSDLKEEIMNFCSDEYVEALPFILFDHKERVLSRDYWIINPLGSVDCLNRNKSIMHSENGKVLEVEKIVIDENRVDNSRHLFRVSDCRGAILVSHRFKEVIQEKKFTNVFFEELPVSAG